MDYRAIVVLLFSCMIVATESTSINNIKRGKVRLIDVPIRQNDVLYDILFDEDSESLVDKTAEALKARLGDIPSVWTRADQRKYEDLYSWHVEVSCDSVQEHLSLFSEDIRENLDEFYDDTHTFKQLTEIGQLCNELVKEEHMDAAFKRLRELK